MHQIRCPWCGVRDEAEFRYRGEADLVRPSADSGSNTLTDAFHAYIYERKDPKGWHIELWHHVGGCRRFVKVVRNTVTHEIAATGEPADRLGAPLP